MRNLGWFLILTQIGFLSAGCSTPDPVTGRGTYNMYTLEEDVELGRQSLQSNNAAMREAGVSINQDPRRMAQLEEMVGRIAAVSDAPELPYTVTLYHTNIVNAAAAPGGSMMVFEGLYDPAIGLVRDDDELAAVMAHEIAHVTCRHVTERLSKARTTGAVDQIAGIAAQVAGYGDVYRMARDVYAVSSTLIIPAYSRKDESEADRVGLRYMANAGYDPRAAIRIWKRAEEEDASRHSSMSIFATHPSNRSRHKALEPLLPRAMEDYRKRTGRYPEGYRPAGP